MNTDHTKISRSDSSLRSFARDPETMWQHLRDLPIMRDWKIARDSAFLLTTFPIGLTAFIVATVGFAAGIPLTFVAGFGVPILAITWGLLQWLLALERSRINGLLDQHVRSPRTWSSTKGNLLERGFSYFTSADVWRSLIYIGALLPIACIELALVVWPGELLISPIVVGLGGSIQPDLLGGWTISNGLEALIAFALGVVALVPFSALINIAARAHARLAQTLIGRRTDNVRSIPTTHVAA